MYAVLVRTSDMRQNDMTRHIDRPEVDGGWSIWITGTLTNCRCEAEYLTDCIGLRCKVMVKL